MIVALYAELAILAASIVIVSVVIAQQDGIDMCAGYVLRAGNAGILVHSIAALVSSNNGYDRSCIISTSTRY